MSGITNVNCLITSIVANGTQYLSPPANPNAFNGQLLFSISSTPPLCIFIFEAITTSNTFIGFQNQYIFTIQVLTNNSINPNGEASFIRVRCTNSVLNSDGKTYISSFTSYIH